MSYIIKIYVAIVAILLSQFSFAQSFPMLRIETDPKSMALGFTDAVSGNIAYASFANPALMSYSDIDFSIAFSYENWQPEVFNERILSVGSYFHITDKFSSSFGFSSGTMLPLYLSDEYGSPIGEYSPYDIISAIGFSYEIMNYLSVGVNLGFLESRMTRDYLLRAAYSDMFLSSSFNDFFVTAGIKSCGLLWKVTDQHLALPLTMVLGGSYNLLLSQFHAFDFSMQYDYMNNSDMDICVGMAYEYKDSFALRAGGRLGIGTLPSSISVGAGIRYEDITIDAAYLIPIASSPINNTWGVSLTYVM